MIDRRTVLARGFAAAALAFAPRVTFARAETDERFVFIIQRGAADGLGMVAPLGDPTFAAHREAFAGEYAKALRLDSVFALHPSLVNTAALYQRREALFAHAIASPYRERSHFDGQNVLETGGAGPYRVQTGWLNRLLGLISPGEARAIAVAATVPTALRGAHEVASFSPSPLPDATEDLLQRVTTLYQGDSQLHALWSEATATRDLTGNLRHDNGRKGASVGSVAAKLLAPAKGARVAMIETSGWDTHTQQRQRLAANLKDLDAMIGSLESGLGSAWNRTTVLVATEFGRTVSINGTNGTDHGTGAAAMLLGGSVVGGRVLADWPGLAPAQLLEGRDLRPTSRLDALVAGACASAFRIDPALTMAKLFPENGAVKALSGLVRP